MRFPVMRGLDLTLIAAALDRAGIAHRALGTDTESNLHTYDVNGNPVDLPDATGPVVAAYVPPVPPPRPDFGGDEAPPDQLAAGVVQLRAYLALPAPTQAQTTAALKLVIRTLLFALKRMV